MADSKFVYVTLIRTTPEKLWAALLEPEFTKQYWHGTVQKSDWKPGAKWAVFAPDGREVDEGEVLAFEPHTKLSVTWRNHLFPELTAEGYGKLTYELKPLKGAVKLTVTHEIGVAESKLIGAVTQGWPGILSSLKSLLETGAALEETAKWPEGF